MHFSCKLSFRHTWHFPGFGAHVGNCSILPLVCVFVVFATTNVVQQREVPKTNLAGAKLFEKLDSRPSSGLKTLCVYLRSALHKPLYREKGEVLSFRIPFHAGSRSLLSFLVAAQTYTMWVLQQLVTAQSVCVSRAVFTIQTFPIQVRRYPNLWRVPIASRIAVKRHCNFLLLANTERFAL